MAASLQRIQNLQHLVLHYGSMYLIFDMSNVAFLSPVDYVWKIKLYIRRQIGCAISRTSVTTKTIHQLCKLSRFLQKR